MHSHGQHYRAVHAMHGLNATNSTAPPLSNGGTCPTTHHFALFKNNGTHQPLACGLLLERVHMTLCTRLLIISGMRALQAVANLSVPYQVRRLCAALTITRDVRARRPGRRSFSLRGSAAPLLPHCPADSGQSFCHVQRSSWVSRVLVHACANCNWVNMALLKPQLCLFDGGRYAILCHLQSLRAPQTLALVTRRCITKHVLLQEILELCLQRLAALQTNEG